MPAQREPERLVGRTDIYDHVLPTGQEFAIPVDVEIGPIVPERAIQFVGNPRDHVQEPLWCLPGQHRIGGFVERQRQL